MSISRKASSFFSWWSHGFSGWPGAPERSPQSRILAFGIRFCLSYLIIQILWHFIHLHYEAVLLLVFKKLCGLIGDFPTLLPVLKPDDTILIKIGPFVFDPPMFWVTNSTPLYVGLMTASLRKPSASGIKAVFWGICILLVYQSLFLFGELYLWVYSGYSIWSDEGLRPWELVEYNTEVFSYLKLLLQCLMLGHYLVPVFLWLTMLYLSGWRSTSIRR